MGDKMRHTRCSNDFPGEYSIVLWIFWVIPIQHSSKVDWGQSWKLGSVTLRR